MAATPPATGPLVRSDTVAFRLPDAHHRLRGVRLAQEIGVPGDRLAFAHRRGAWQLELARPAVDRMEYLFELQEAGGSRHTVPDPGNPLRAPGAFGDKSVVQFPGYTAPAWTSAPRAPGRCTEHAVPTRALAAAVRATVWAPDALAPDVAAPLLVVHDGPEFASLGGIVDWAAAGVAAGELPPLRVALLAPGDRNRWYAVSPAYARALTAEVVPALRDAAPASRTVLVGASLGALAALHAHRHRPGTFDALFLQSGSFFHPEFDAQESGFSRYRPVTRFVADLSRAVAEPAPVPTVLTCGTVEENLANNRAVASVLQRLGYPARFVEVPDAHNFTAWRDALHPHLTGLVQQVTVR